MTPRANWTDEVFLPAARSDENELYRGRVEVCLSNFSLGKLLSRIVHVYEI